VVAMCGDGWEDGRGEGMNQYLVFLEEVVPFFELVLQLRARSHVDKTGTEPLDHFPISAIRDELQHELALAHDRRLAEFHDLKTVIKFQ